MLKYLKLAVVCAWLISQSVDFSIETWPDEVHLQILPKSLSLTQWNELVDTVYHLVPEMYRPNQNNASLFVWPNWEKK